MDKRIVAGIENICEIKKTLVDCVKSEISNGLQDVDTKELGEVVDMIKDLAEAAYYENVTAAMEETTEEMEKYGYNRNRYSSGRYAPSGHGNRTMGFDHNIREMPYVEEYLNENPSRFGYHEDYSHMESEMAPRYGRAFNQFKASKRHYTETNSPEYKEKMMMHANEHLNDTITSLRELWESADKDMKRRIKDDMTRLVGEMQI